MTVLGGGDLRTGTVGIRLQHLLYKLAGLGSDGGIVAEALEPADVGLTAKPGELAFGVVAVGLASGGDALGFGGFATQDGASLAVAKRIEGAGCFAVLGDESAGFVDEAVGEHRGGAGVDAGVKAGPGRVDSDAEDTIAGERVAAGFPCLGERLAGCEADFDGADELGLVVGVDARSGSWIETAEKAVQPSGAVDCSAALEVGAGLFRALWAGEKAIDQSTQVEACATGHDGQLLAGNDGGQGLTCEAGVVAGCAKLVGGKDVDEVMLPGKQRGENDEEEEGDEEVMQ